MTEPTLLLVYALAIARLTGLVTVDSITENARHALISWLDDRPKTFGAAIATLIECPWCVSIWVSIVVAPLAYLWGDHPVLLIPALVLAFSQATGMVSNMGR